MDIGARILSVAKEKGITQAMLAERLGVNQSSISKWGRGSFPTRSVDISQIADAIGVPEDYLLTGFTYKERVMEQDIETGETREVPQSEYKDIIIHQQKQIDTLQEQVKSAQNTIHELMLRNQSLTDELLGRLRGSCVG